MSQKHGMFDDSSEEDIARKRFRNWQPRLRDRTRKKVSNLPAQQAGPSHAEDSDPQEGPSHAVGTDQAGSTDDADSQEAGPSHAVHAVHGNPNSGELFKSPTLVYENDAFKILVQKQDFKRQKKFSLDDHLYLLKVEQKTSSSTLPFLKDIVSILDSILSHILNEMKQFYKKEETNVIYITIKQPTMTSPIRSQGMNLNSPSEAIVKHILSTFYIFSNSEDTLRLDKGFNIYFKVLSHSNVILGSKRRKAYLNSKLGCNETYFITGCIQIKESVQAQFENLCLLVSALILFAKYKHYDLFQTLKPLWSPLQNDEKACSILKFELKSLAHNLQLPLLGPYPLEILNDIAKLYDVQFHVIFNIQIEYGSIESFPHKLDLSLKQLFLFQSSTSHVIAIDNLHTFFLERKKKFCLECKRSYYYYYSHFCIKKEYQCKQCFGHLYDEKFFSENKNLPFSFCNSTIQTELETLFCQKCNVTFKTKLCFENHRKNRVCKRRSNCLKCQTKEVHECFQKSQYFCQNCNQNVIKGNHDFCKLFIHKPSRVWEKLFFFDFIYATNSVNSLLSCGIFCEKERGRFDKIVFTANYDSINDEKFYFDYDPKKLRPELPSKNNNYNIETSNLIETLQHKKQKSIEEKFLLFFFLNASKNSVFLSANQNNNNMSTVLKILNDQNLTPILLKKDSNFILLKVKFMKTTFLNISNFFNFDNRTLYDNFCSLLKEDYRYFPLNLKKSCHEGVIPDLSYFECWIDSQKQIDQKKNFWMQHKNKYWSFQNELILYTEQQVKVVATACLEFLKDTIDFQSIVLKNSERPIEILFPFTSQTPTLPSFSYGLLSYLFLYKEDIVSFSKENICRSDFCSRPEFEYCCYIESRNPEKTYMYALKSKGQKRFGNYNVDLFCVEDKSILQFEGCYMKSHFPPECTDIYRQKLTGQNDYSKQMKFQDYLEKFHAGEFSTVSYMYECKWKEMKKKDPDVINFFKENKQYLANLPMTKMKPRISQRGGMTETYNFFWEKNDAETFFHSDINSAYPFVCSNGLFPVGSPQIISDRRELEKIVVKNNHLFYEDFPLEIGFIFCQVLAPTNLKFPFLQYRTSDANVFMSLCRKCSENRVLSCKHRCYESKSYKSVWNICEINKALKLGYTLLSVFEIHFFRKSKCYLKEFIQTLNSFRMKYSCPENACPIQYCNEVNQKLDLPESLKLSPEMLERSEMKKSFIKLKQNSCIGKFSSKLRNEFTIVIRSKEELSETLKKFNILEIESLNENSLLVKYENPFARNSNRFSIYIGSLVTALARIYLYEQVEKILNVTGSRLYSVDTDSIAYSLPKNVNNPLTFSSFLGDFKNVLPENSVVQNFYSLGNRNYCVSYFDPSANSICVVMKSKGLSLKSRFSNNHLTPEIYSDFIKSAFNEELKKLKIDQQRKKTQKPFGDQKETMTHFTFSNCIYVKRILTDNFSSIPYGFKNK